MYVQLRTDQWGSSVMTVPLPANAIGPLLEAIEQPCVLLDAETLAVAAYNTPARRLLGPDLERLLNEPADALRHSAGRQAFIAACRQVAAAGPNQSTALIEQLLDRPNPLVVHTTLRTVHLPGTRLIVCTHREHTEPHALSCEALVAITAQLPLGVLIVEPAVPDRVWVNRQAAALCGLPQAGAHSLQPSRRSWKLCHEDGRELRDDELPLVSALKQTPPATAHDYLLVPGDGSPSRLVTARTAAVRDQRGTLVAAVTTIVDVSEVRAIEAELRHARTQAELQARHKGAFYSALSRELRTPLTSILGYVDLIAEQAEANREHAEWCRRVRRSGEALMSIMQDLVDLGQMEAGTFTLQRARFLMSLVVAEVLSHARSDAERRGLGVVVRYTTPVPRTLRWEAARLRQALTALTTLVIEHTSRGDVTLQVAMIGEEGARRLAFDITSQCNELTPEHLRDLFDPFTPGASAWRTGGLAAAVSKRLAELMGGGIEASCEDGRLWLRLTLAVEPEDLADLSEPSSAEHDVRPPSLVPPPRLRGSVLVVEDNENDRQLISKMLARQGLRVECVTSGVEALRAPVGTFDAILMDVEMPGMDGLETTRRLRQAGVTSPIIALTAAALAGDRDRCLEAGCTAYVSKPIDRPVLVRTLDDLISTTEDRRLLSELPADLAVIEPLRSSREGDPIIRDILAQFVARLNRSLEQLAQYVRADDRPAAERAARAVAGTARNYGFEPLSAAADELARACARPDETEAEVGKRLKAVEFVAQRVQVAYLARSNSWPPPPR